jgi:hypothetical protein
MKEITRARQQEQESLRTTGAKTCFAESFSEMLQKITNYEIKQ